MVLQKYLSRIEILISTAEGFRSEALQAPNETIVLKNEELWRFLVSALQTTRAISSDESHYYQELKQCRDDFRRGEPLRLSECIGILRALSDDLQYGVLSNINELVAAEIFDELIDMSLYLQGKGYHLPAIAVTGAVLEDTLRKICLKNSVIWEGESAISKLNTALYKANIYDKVQFGQIDAWGKLRNKVDHGNFTSISEVDPKDGYRMIQGVRDFMIKFLT